MMSYLSKSDGALIGQAALDLVGAIGERVTDHRAKLIGVHMTAYIQTPSGPRIISVTKELVRR